MSEFTKIKANGVNYGLSDKKLRDNIAVIEPSGISSNSYSIGEYLIFDGVLYKVISSIQAGDALEVFENIESVKVVDILKYLEDNKMDNGGSITNAEYATTAGTANYATTAGSVENATHATTADTATSATSASTATSATTAEKAGKLSNTTDIGSSTTPVYFSSNGVPVAATPYSNASVLKATQDGNGNTISTYYQQKIIHTTVTIASDSWTQNSSEGVYEATVTVSGVTSTNDIHVSPAPDYLTSGVYAYSQSTDTLVFRCQSKPSASVVINVEIQN